jgi:uncharacterized membrane protein YdjX (TVP38/TMEM64 family)
VSRPLLKRKRFWAGMVLLVAMLTAWALLPGHIHRLRDIEWASLRDNLRALDPWLPVIAILLYGLTTVLFLPTTLVTILVSLLYGPWLGLPIALIGLTLGMGSAFLCARYLFRDWFQRRYGHTRFYSQLQTHMNSRGWKLVLFTRLLPINPFTLFNYACGLTPIAFGPYLLASAIGVIPNTLALLWTTHATGQLALGHFDARVILLLFAGAGLFALLAWLPRRKQPHPPATP